MTLKESLHEHTRQYLRECLVRAQGNRTQAARMAGVDRTYWYRLWAKYNCALPDSINNPNNAQPLSGAPL